MQTVIMEIELATPDHDCGPDCFCWQAAAPDQSPDYQPAEGKRARRHDSTPLVRFPKVS